MDTTTSVDGAPSPWHVQPVSTTLSPPFNHGGPFGLATTGAISRSAKIAITVLGFSLITLSPIFL